MNSTQGPFFILFISKRLASNLLCGDHGTGMEFRASCLLGKRSAW